MLSYDGCLRKYYWKSNEGESIVCNENWGSIGCLVSFLSPESEKISDDEANVFHFKPKSDIWWYRLLTLRGLDSHHCTLSKQKRCLLPNMTQTVLLCCTIDQENVGSNFAHFWPKTLSTEEWYGPSPHIFVVQIFFKNSLFMILFFDFFDWDFQNWSHCSIKTATIISLQDVCVVCLMVVTLC